MQQHNVRGDLQQRLRNFYAELDLLLWRHEFAFGAYDSVILHPVHLHDLETGASPIGVNVRLLMLPSGTRLAERYQYNRFQHGVTFDTLVHDRAIKIVAPKGGSGAQSTL